MARSVINSPPLAVVTALVAACAAMTPRFSANPASSKSCRWLLGYSVAGSRGYSLRAQRLASSAGPQPHSRRVRKQRARLVLGNLLARHPVLRVRSLPRFYVRARDAARTKFYHRLSVARILRRQRERQTLLPFFRALPFPTLSVRPAATRTSLVAVPVTRGDERGPVPRFRGSVPPPSNPLEREISRLPLSTSLLPANRAMKRHTLDEPFASAHRHRARVVPIVSTFSVRQRYPAPIVIPCCCRSPTGRAGDGHHGQVGRLAATIPGCAAITSISASLAALPDAHRRCHAPT